MTPFIFSVRSFLAASLLLVTITCFACVRNANADDDHSEGQRRYRKGHSSSLGRDKGNKGNEFTGQSAAWIFAIANLSVALSLISKGVIRLTPLATKRKERIKFLNKLQKKYLMRFHYLLNPLAVLVALLHFSLSCCRSSSFPEWGLAAASSLALIGVVIKLKVTPKSIRKAIHKIHTSPVPLGLVFLVLLVGHSIVD